MNADLNASINIRTAGLAELACEVNGMPSIRNVTMKQEPTESSNQDMCLARDVGILALYGVEDINLCTCKTILW